MRDFSRVYSSFWQSPDARKLDEDSRILALYLLTTPHGNLVGCFRLPDAYAAEDLQWPLERVSEGFRKLCENGFISRDEGSKWLFIVKYLKWNTFENPNVAKAAHKAFDQIPDIELKSALALALLECGAHLSEEFRKCCETLSERYRKPKPEPKPLRSRSRASTNPKPKTTSGDGSHEPPPVTNAVWAAYEEAYESKYGAKPVRNARVNGQLANVIAAIGSEAAPHVARFYLTHKNGLYVSAMHPVNLLLRDAEKLHTEYATGRQMTRTQGAQADKTQTNLNAFKPLLDEAKALEAGDGQRQVA